MNGDLSRGFDAHSKKKTGQMGILYKLSNKMQLSLITVFLEDAQEIGDLDRDDLVKQRAAKHRKEELSREHNIKKSVNSILMHYTIIRCLDPKYVGNDQIWFIEK